MPVPHAANPARTRGRLHPQPPSVTRDPFSRDRDRIVHSVAFRGLNGKTQVFAATAGDHFRVRLTHTLEVVQIARTIARALGLNEDLTEACALAHDLGHPPFGHAGEEALNAALASAGGWDHNGHTLRVVTQLEKSYPDFDGLNLSWETLEGLAKHNGPVSVPGWALAQADARWSLELSTWPSLEAQVAALADDIAYDCHDLDDALRSGLIDTDALLAVPFLAQCRAEARARFPGTEEARLKPELIREALGQMVADLIVHTRAVLAEAAPADPDAVRSAGRALAVFSPAMAATERELKAFLYRAFYHHPAVVRVTRPAAQCVSALFAALAADPARLPPAWAATLPAAEPDRARHIADYVAGMTDRFAIREHERLVGPSPLPDDGF
jgi:dGTPase